LRVIGKADMRLDGEKFAELGDGQFVGQIAYITGEKAPVSIVAKRSTRIISWSRVKLKTFFKDGPDVEQQLGHRLGADLTRLLKSAWQSPR
jgi:CRP-like cAMP-binding protein